MSFHPELLVHFNTYEEVKPKEGIAKESRRYKTESSQLVLNWCPMFAGPVIILYSIVLTSVLTVSSISSVSWCRSVTKRPVMKEVVLADRCGSKSVEKWQQPEPVDDEIDSWTERLATCRAGMENALTQVHWGCFGKEQGGGGHAVQVLEPILWSSHNCWLSQPEPESSFVP